MHCVIYCILTSLCFGATAAAQLVVTTAEDQFDAPAGSELSLREAIRDASDGEVITFDPSLNDGTIILGQGGSGSGQLLINKNLIVDASGLPGGLTINANGESRVVEVAPGNTVSLVGLKLTGGVASVSTNPDTEDNKGGAVFNNHSTLTIRDCSIFENSAYQSGGGIYNAGDFQSQGTSTLTIVNTEIFNNSSRGGGGIVNGGYLAGHAILSLHDCKLYNNSSIWGDGIMNYGRFSTGYARLSLHTCTLENHSGNAIQSTSRDDGRSEIFLNQCTISGNEGGIYSDARNGSATLDVTSCTISGNHGIGGIFTDGGVISSLKNTILADNTSEEVGGDLRELGRPFESYTTLLGKNIISDTSGNNGLSPTSALIVASPTLAPPGDYGGSTRTMPPLPGSPAIDAATDSSETEDQRGFPIVGAADIGAVEYQGTSDISRYWPLDWDGDGNTYGIEQALGTNPLISDLNHASNPVLSFDEFGKPVFRIGRSSTAISGTVWIVSKSADLSPGSFLEIYRFDGITNTPTIPNDDVDFIVDGDSILVTDQKPSASKGFYRFEASFPP